MCDIKSNVEQDTFCIAFGDFVNCWCLAWLAHHYCWASVGALIAMCAVDASKQHHLVVPASSHMLVSKIKPCMSEFKLLFWWSCEWLIISVIICSVTFAYMDNGGNSRANTCTHTWLSSMVVFIDVKTNSSSAWSVAWLIINEWIARRMLAMYCFSFWPISFRR